MTTQVTNIIDQDEMRQMQREQGPAFKAVVEQFKDTAQDAASYFEPVAESFYDTRIRDFATGAVFATVLFILMHFIR